MCRSCVELAVLDQWISLDFHAGLVFHDLSNAATSSRARLSVIFYVLLLFQLLPFSFMSFFVADRKFFLADVTTNLYTPSAYFVAASLASECRSRLFCLSLKISSALSKFARTLWIIG